MEARKEEAPPSVTIPSDTKQSESGSCFTVRSAPEIPIYDALPPGFAAVFAVIVFVFVAFVVVAGVLSSRGSVFILAVAGRTGEGSTAARLLADRVVETGRESTASVLGMVEAVVEGVVEGVVEEDVEGVVEGVVEAVVEEVVVETMETGV